MADNVSITPGTGATVAADDVAGALYQRVKLALGADGTAVDAQGGAGAVGPAVQRVTLASDDPVVTAIGEVQASPTTNTVLDRLKALLTGISLAAGTAVIGAVNLISGQTGITGGAGSVAANTPRVTLANDDAAGSALARIGDGDYETVAASQSTQTLGASGAAGDYLMGVLIVPATTSPGAVQIKDGTNTAITVFAGGADSVSNLVPFLVPLGIRSAQGAWQVTTGADVSAVAVGSFS